VSQDQPNRGGVSLPDAELLRFVGLEGHEAWVKNLTPERRAIYERMMAVTSIINAGLGQHLGGVLIDGPRPRKRRRR
jgi:hypothetical protein